MSGLKKENNQGQHLKNKQTRTPCTQNAVRNAIRTKIENVLDHFRRKAIYFKIFFSKIQILSRQMFYEYISHGEKLTLILYAVDGIFNVYFV